MEIPVNRSTIINAPESSELLKARKSIIATDIEKLKRQCSIYEEELNRHLNEGTQLTFSNEEETSRLIDKRLASIGNFDQDVVEQLLDDTRVQIKKINAEIKASVRNNNDFLDEVYKLVNKYVQILNIESDILQKNDFIFTHDLRSLSGAVFQKLVFAFKLAFLKVTEKKMDTKLFMVIDSPKSKELDASNTGLISRRFSYPQTKCSVCHSCN